MSRRLFSVFVMLCAGTLVLRAQDHPVTVPDGPVVKLDSLQSRPQPLPVMSYPLSPGIRQPSILRPPLFETKEQRAARVNAAVQTNVMNYTDQSLRWYRPPKLSREVRAALFVTSLFLSNPYGFREGYVPLMNHSFPFIEAKTPGMAPYDNPYSPDRIPQAIRSEYDFATGTYKTVMVSWEDFQKSLLVRPGGNSFGNTAIPRVEVTPGDRIVR